MAQKAWIATFLIFCSCVLQFGDCSPNVFITVNTRSCDGIFVSPTYILTSANCFVEDASACKQGKKLSIKSQGITMQGGSNCVDIGISPCPNPSFKINGTKVIIPQKYFINGCGLDSDVAAVMINPLFEAEQYVTYPINLLPIIPDTLTSYVYRPDSKSTLRLFKSIRNKISKCDAKAPDGTICASVKDAKKCFDISGAALMDGMMVYGITSKQINCDADLVTSNHFEVLATNLADQPDIYCTVHECAKTEPRAVYEYEIITNNEFI